MILKKIAVFKNYKKTNTKQMFKIICVFVLSFLYLFGNFWKLRTTFFVWFSLLPSFPYFSHFTFYSPTAFGLGFQSLSPSWAQLKLDDFGQVRFRRSDDIVTTSSLHRRYIVTTSTSSLHRRYIVTTSSLHRRYIVAKSSLHRCYIVATSSLDCR